MKILVLSVWFPYPPVHGGKNRAYHLLKALAREHDVALCSFEDVPVQAEGLEHVRQFCRRVEVVPRPPFARTRVGTLRGWLSLKPSHVRAGYSREMAAGVRALAATWAPDRIVALTVGAAPYALGIRGIPRALDLDPVLSDVLHDAYVRAGHAPQRVRRWLAWRKFRRHEARMIERFDHCVVVSDRDRRAVLSWRPGYHARVSVVPNGVDTSFNCPGLATPQPNTLIYNGALTYDANYDAVAYFLQDIFPLVRQASGDVSFRITGATTGVDLSDLPLDGATTCTGFLEDVRQAVAASWACVVPLRIGGGTRVKILEAMALGTPVVSTPKGAEGLDVVPGEHLLIAGTPAEFAAATVRLLGNVALRERLTSSARQRVAERYEWAEIGRRFRAVVEGLRSHGTLP